MKKNEKTSMSKRRATVAAVLCFVAAIAIAGTYTFNDYRKTQKNELAKAEEKSRQKETKKDNKDNSDLTRETGTSKVKSENTGSSTKKSAADESTVDEKNESDGTGMTDQSEQNGTGTQATAGKSHNINFTEDSYILWPVNGAVIMSYSMDKTVYFQTLDQYKYNPAVIIAGEVNDKVYAVAKGQIKSIKNDEVTGCTVTVDLGDGYEAVYGQLKELNFAEGDYVEAGHVLGYIGEPTKYFTVEGSNLYFELDKDGIPVDPIAYFE